MLIHCNLSLSSGVSAAILSRSRVLLCCEVTCLSLAVCAVHLARSFSLCFFNLSLLCSTVSAARRALSLSFLHRHQSSCSCADLRALLGSLWASMFTHRWACACFGLKESRSTCICGMKHPPFNSLVWGSLRLAPTIFALSTALYLFYLYCIYSSIIHRIILMFVVFSVKLPVELEFQLLYIGGGTKCLQNAINTCVLNAQHFGGLHIVETDDNLNGTSTAQMAQKHLRSTYM